MVITSDLAGRVGNVTDQPELRFSAKGTPVCRFGLAWRPWTAKGEPEADTVFYEVVSFGSLAEHVAECVNKGDRVVVTGKGELDHWTGRDGTERVTQKIVADGVGPDLRWNTVTVERSERKASERPAPTALDGDGEPF